MLQIDELLSLGVNVTVYNGQVMAAQLLCFFLLRSAWFYIVQIQCFLQALSSVTFSSSEPARCDLFGDRCGSMGGEAQVREFVFSLPDAIIQSFRQCL